MPVQFDMSKLTVDVSGHCDSYLLDFSHHLMKSFQFLLLHMLQISDETAVVAFLRSLVESREQSSVKSFLCK